MFYLETKEAGTDNRNIIDDGKSQKLTHDDIKALKDKGIKGQVILYSIAYYCFTSEYFLLESYIARKLQLESFSAEECEQMSYSD